MFPAVITNLPLLYGDYYPESYLGGSSRRGGLYPSYKFNDSDDLGSDEDLSFDGFKEPWYKKCNLKLPKDWYKNKKLWPFISVGVGAVFGIMFAAGSSAIGTGAAASAVATWISVNIGLTVGIIAAGALAGAGIGLGVLVLGLAICALKKRCKPKEIFAFKALPRLGLLSTISERSSEDSFSTDNSPFRDNWTEVHHKVLKHSSAADFNRFSENYFSPTAVSL